MATYFISDIHLSDSSTENSRILLEFLRTVGPTADAIYILGDLFALWVGDDLNQGYANPIITALKTLANRKISLYLMRGNRDFLLGSKFCALSGCSLLDDPCVIELYGKQVLLTHGDLLCTEDLKYQQYRKIVQNPIIKKLFLSLPISIRLKIANWVKSKSSSTKRNYTATKDLSIWDVTPKTVEAWIKHHQVEFMIHGHTHKPAIHKLANSTRIVLGDWNENSAQILNFGAQGFELQDIKHHS